MKLLVLLLTIGFQAQLWAHEPIVEVKLDSVSITVENQASYIIHEVLPKQTLYTISKAYNIGISEIYVANPELRNRLVKMNEQIKIPLTGMSIAHTIGEGPKAYYVVQPKETMFRLARVYFNMNIEDLKALNNLLTNELEIGQKILIGTLIRKATEETIGEVSDAPLFEEAERTLLWKEEKSVAYWQKDSDESQALFVLHNSAPINSLVEVTNPMYGRHIQAQVVGRIPESAYTKDIDVILSSGLANELGAIDPRFYVKVKYLK